MKKEYDFSKGRRNPYTKLLKQQITIRLDHATLKYFKMLAKEIGMPYQTLINFYLRECAINQLRPTVGIGWRLSARKGAA